MSGQWWTVIRGSDLREILRERNPTLASALDPSGINVVAESHPIADGSGVHGCVLLKLANRRAPVAADLELPNDTWNRVTLRVWFANGEVSVH